jgi:hypothetical protein
VPTAGNSPVVLKSLPLSFTIATIGTPGRKIKSLAPRADH